MNRELTESRENAGPLEEGLPVARSLRNRRWTCRLLRERQKVEEGDGVPERGRREKNKRRRNCTRFCKGEEERKEEMSVDKPSGRVRERGFD